jgi:hypothetical protein
VSDDHPGESIDEGCMAHVQCCRILYVEWLRKVARTLNTLVLRSVRISQNVLPRRHEWEQLAETLSERPMVRLELEDVLPGPMPASWARVIAAMPSLTVLRLDSLPWMTDTLLAETLCSCGVSLIELGVSSCRAVTGQSLRAISALCPHVRVLELRRMHSEVTAEETSELALGCRRLESIDLRNTVSRMTSAAVLALLELPELQVRKRALIVDARAVVC